MRQGDEEHLHHVVEVQAREADPEGIDEHQPAAEEGGEHMEPHGAACGKRERHHERAANGRHKPLCSESTRGCKRRGLLVRTRGAAFEAERGRRPVHEQFGERWVHVEKVGPVVVPI